MQRISPKNINTIEFWEAEYKKREPESHQRFEVVAELIRRSGGKRILDIGCGLGEVYEALEKIGYHTDFYGVDFSANAIEYCKENFPGAHWISAPIGDIPLDAYAFDVVVSCEVLEHMEDPRDLTKDMQKFVRDEGQIILTTPRGLAIPCPEHVWAFNDQDIQLLFPERKVSIVPDIFPQLITAVIKKDARVSS